MRAAFLLPLALSAALVAACGSEVSSVPEREEPTRLPAPPDRDLTLQAPVISAAEVASAVELARPRPKPKPAQQPVPEPEPRPEAVPVEEPVIVPAVAVTEEPAEPPAPEVDVAAGGRERSGVLEQCLELRETELAVAIGVRP